RARRVDRARAHPLVAARDARPAARRHLAHRRGPEGLLTPLAPGRAGSTLPRHMTTLKTVSPVDGRVYVERSLATEAELDRKLAAAVSAQRAWRDTPREARAERLSAFLDRVTQRSDALAEELTWQMGRPRAQTPGELR